MRNKGWVVVVFETAELANFSGEVAYVAGPFEQYEVAEDWSNEAKDCLDGTCQIAFIANDT